MTRTRIKFLEDYSVNTLRDVTPPGAGFAQNDVLIFNGTSWQRSRAEFEYAESIPVSQTTATTYQDKLTYNSGSLIGGLYKVNFYAELGNNSKSKISYIRTSIDGVPHGYGSHELSEVSSPALDDAQYTDICSMKVLELTPGGHNFSIHYRTAQPNTTAYIRRARISLERVIRL